jgi:hypothetical protein
MFGRSCANGFDETIGGDVRRMSALRHAVIWLEEEKLTRGHSLPNHQFLSFRTAGNFRFSLAENRMQSIILAIVIQWISKWVVLLRAFDRHQF